MIQRWYLSTHHETITSWPTTSMNTWMLWHMVITFSISHVNKPLQLYWMNKDYVKVHCCVRFKNFLTILSFILWFQYLDFHSCCLATQLASSTMSSHLSWQNHPRIYSLYIIIIIFLGFSNYTSNTWTFHTWVKELLIIIWC
jgi:hypothetical protein